MDATAYANHIAILQEELVCALGCTEPIAVALAVAKAAGGHGRFFLLPEETHDTVFLAALADPEASSAIHDILAGPY